MTRGDRGAPRAHQGGGAGAIRAHLRYVEYQGVAREGKPGELYPAARDPNACDCQQLPFIVALVGSAEITDLRPLSAT
ncbi:MULTISPECIES: hypothetical protein [Bradyrhizobium]|jgi:hypothetical protein|uniref:hypothetical protein n=1 Tax=Bradyrhizobium TaxID=374 RepID=UPI000484A6BC|nr:MULTISPECIES: hypothetical protein [Bradyrhizobium]MCS3451539.1 hypothetical protein [Bradyrhizobium elkanii]MCS3566362.1 hypothetical protein [Bradyrhizobium elkanii]MCW2152909.1 hypothetical protein [Bradyrhizobium elkanii]MCW2357355.1 hypothetical protein [Bradyrhizobium elkanii]MCW2376641.1 hypothetical protein [Bradyrhizobium elkanii]